MNSTRQRAEEFVLNLMENGTKCSCDDTVPSFTNNENLPPFYDENKFKRGQEFYHRNIFAMYIAKIHGLLALLAIPTIVKLLKSTKMSSEPFTAYRRYLSTIFHMCIWYDNDFKPNSPLWKSIAEVKNKHNSASKKGCSIGLGRISQKDMCFTQFGFIGFVLVRGNLIGIHNAKDEDLEALIHVWRVVGYILGIEDRFNLCRDSLEETRHICNILIEEHFKVALQQKNSDFIEMSSALLTGMWCMNPFLNTPVFINHLQKLVQYPTVMYEPLFKLKFYETILFKYVEIIAFATKYNILRIYLNLLQYLTLFLMHYFPFLAYYKFGKANSHVQILSERPKKN